MTIVVTRLIGGLGNQMFQYAAGRAIASRFQVPLKLDIRGFDSYALRNYDLYRYSIDAEVAGPHDLVPFETGDPSAAIKFHETQFHYDPRIEALRPPIYLDGYWQSDRYFGNIADQIRQQFKPRERMDSTTLAILSRIDNTQAASIHVRRGDYVSNSVTNQYHGLPGLDYFERAMAIVRERVHNPVFFVFSDDHTWVRENLNQQGAVIPVIGNGADTAFIDLMLMSACRHHIIANSSFSWWGAWLNNRPGKTVIAPQPWLKGRSVDTHDLLNSKWITLPMG